MTTLPLSDDQLRQVAALYAIEAARRCADDTVGHLEALDDTLEALGITIDPDAIDEHSDAIAERIGDLIDTARITVDWPGAEPVVVLDGIR